MAKRLCGGVVLKVAMDKVCITCGENKAFEDYYNDGKGKKQSACKECRKLYNKARYKAKQSVEQNKSRVRMDTLRNVGSTGKDNGRGTLVPVGYKGMERERFISYGITKEQYNKLLDIQDNKCAICGIDLNKINTNNVHIDHCHTTNIVRGILCGWCNKGLGYFKDNKTNLSAAINYLDK
jgi:hypothetical protein